MPKIPPLSHFASEIFHGVSGVVALTAILLLSHELPWVKALLTLLTSATWLGIQGLEIYKKRKYLKTVTEHRPELRAQLNRLCTNDRWVVMALTGCLGVHALLCIATATDNIPAPWLEPVFAICYFLGLYLWEFTINITLNTVIFQTQTVATWQGPMEHFVRALEAAPDPSQARRALETLEGTRARLSALQSPDTLSSL